MATTDTTSADDTVVTVLHRGLVEEVRPLTIPFKSFYMQADPYSTGRTVQIPTITDPGPAVAATEGTDITATAIATGNAQVVATEQALMATPTDVLEEASPFEAFSWVRETLGRSLAERLNDQFAALLAAYANVSGTTTVDLSLQQFIGAVGALSGRDARGPYHAVLHPQQVLDLRAGSGNTPGGIIPGPAANLTGLDFTASPNFRQSIMNSIQREAYAGDLLGVDIWQTSSVITANAGADRAGAVFAEEAGAWHELRGFRVESQRDASLRATELVASYNLGVIEVLDTFGQSIITDA
jgi:hypothetical protein